MEEIGNRCNQTHSEASKHSKSNQKHAEPVTSIQRHPEASSGTQKHSEAPKSTQSTISRKSGNSESWKTGNTEIRKSRKPQSRKPGKQESQKVGKPECRRAGNADTFRGCKGMQRPLQASRRQTHADLSGDTQGGLLDASYFFFNSWPKTVSRKPFGNYFIRF